MEKDNLTMIYTSINRIKTSNYQIDYNSVEQWRNEVRQDRDVAWSKLFDVRDGAIIDSYDFKKGFESGTKLCPLDKCDGSGIIAFPRLRGDRPFPDERDIIPVKCDCKRDIKS